MNYLSPLQFRVLKYSALPGLLMLFYYFVLREKFPTSTLMGQYIKAGSIGLIMSWEFLIRKDFKRAGIFIAGGALLYFLLMLAFNRLHLGTRAGFFNIYYQVFTFLAFWGMLLIRGILLKDRSFVKTALLTMLIWYYGTGDMRGLFFIFDILVDWITDGPSRTYQYVSIFIYGLYQFLLPCFYYIILYFTENYLNDANAFRQKFHSKILVMTREEYLFFYGVLFMFVMGSSAAMGQMMEAAEHIKYSSDSITAGVILVMFYVLCPMLTIVLSGYLLRNIMVARSLTIDLHNGFLYYLHCLPFLNLIPVLIYSTRKDAHTSISENAAAYVKRDDSKMANWIIVVGVLMSVFGLYQGYNMIQQLSFYSANDSLKAVIAVITVLQLIRLINFLRLRNSRKAVFVLFTINLLSICILLMGSLEFVSLRVGICYMSLFLLLEIFHPTLFGADAEAVPASAYTED